MANLNFIDREDYLNTLVSFKDKGVIKVITGIRRCGKSTLLLKIFTEWLKKNGVSNEQIIAIDLELKTNSHLCDEQELYRYIKSKIVKNSPNYVLIDEVQNCAGFQKAIASLHKEGIDVYITGSNAFILSGELATFLSGRYVQIKMLPLSFKEFVNAQKQSLEHISLEKLYQKYIQIGSFPQVTEFGENEKLIGEYLDAIYNTIFKKDIIDRRSIANPAMLEDVIKFVFDNIGCLLSSKKISDTMTSNGRKISQPTIENYLTYLEEAFLIYKANRYDIKGKEYLKSLSKYYIADLGMRNYLLNYHGMDKGRMLENIIYLELLKRGYKIHIGKVDTNEVDFIATKGGEIKYIQVAETISSQETLKREISPFKQIKDFHQRILITLDYDPNVSYDGILHINALDFLMN
ncbi:MAG: ATP-binding protein [Treponema sp.]|nr:ATP-binding protein [Treponema sp.]